MTAAFPVTAERVTMYDAIDAENLPPDTIKAAGYVNGRWPSHDAIAARFPRARVRGIDVLGTGWQAASVTDWEDGNPAYGHPDMLRAFVTERNTFRPETACVYTNLHDLPGVEAALEGLWHILWVANWGADGAVGKSLTGTRTAAGNLIVATQLQNCDGYDMSDTLATW